MKILISNPLPPEAEQRITAAGGIIVRGSGPHKKDLMDDLNGCQVLVVSQKPDGYSIDSEVLGAGRDLKLVARFGVGMEMIDMETAKRLGILVTNTAGSNANAVAEHTIYLLLACGRNARRTDLRFRQGAFFELRQDLSVELEGSVLGLVGCGHIGSLVAKKAVHGFGMEVMGYDPYLPAARRIPEVHYCDSLEELLDRSDFVSLHLPVLPETRGFMNRERLSRMKPGAMLVNTSRGEVLVESDLADALQAGQLGASGLDVFGQEPLPLSSGLFALDNLIMTPHTAAFTAKTMRTTSLYVAESIVDLLEGRTPSRLL